nr:hypothetical protein [Tanacetum cinerariifolium]
NSLKQIHAIVDGKAMVISESSVRSNLLFNDEDVSHELQTEAHIEQILPSLSTYQRKYKKTHKPRKSKKVTEFPQTNVPLDIRADEAVYQEGSDSVERAITTDASLVAVQDNDNITKTQSTAMSIDHISQEIGSSDRPRRQETTLGGAYAQTRFETASKRSSDPPLSTGYTVGSGEDKMEKETNLTDFVPPTPYDSPLLGGHTPGSDEGRPNLLELMNICTQLSNRVLALEEAKTTQDKGSGEKGSSTTDQVSTARPEVSAATPSTLPTTTIFGDEDLTIAQTFIKMRSEKANEKGERQKQEEATIAALTEEFDEIQVRMDSDHELVAIRNKPPTRTQVGNRMITYLKHMGKYTHQQLKNKTLEELQMLYEREKKWINDFVSMDSKKEEKKSVEPECKDKKGKRIKRVADSAPKQKSSKKQKIMQEQESAKSDEEESADTEQENKELRMWLTVVSDEEETVDPEILSTKYPIVDWESHILENVDMEDKHVYKIIRANRNTSYHKSLSSLLRKFDRQDLVDLHRLVMKRFEDNTLEGYNLLIWGDFKVMFEPNTEDEI